MKKLVMIVTIISFTFAYPSCNMCHNGRIAPDLAEMSKKEIIQKLIQMKNKKVNPKMAFIKNYSNKEIEKMVNELKD